MDNGDQPDSIWPSKRESKEKEKIAQSQEKIPIKGQGSFFKAEAGKNLDEPRLYYCATKQGSVQHMTSQMVRLSILTENLTIKINYYNNIL